MLAFTTPALVPWTVLTVIGGLTFAIVIHRWNSRHPSQIVSPELDVAKRPEINLSAIPVGGNIGGLMFMAGSLAILVAGLPKWRWFFAVAVAGGFLTAAALVKWHATHGTHDRGGSFIVLH